MKHLPNIAAIFLGLVFTVFGLNGFLNFIPMPPMEGDPGTFFSVMGPTGYIKVVKALEVIGGLMMIFNFKRAGALCLLIPIIVNIVLFELLIAKQPGLGLLLLAISGYLVYAYKEKFQALWS